MAAMGNLLKDIRKGREDRSLYLRGILPYQDAATGMIYQVIDRPDVPGNYLEASGSAMLACAILKGVRLKVLLADK